MQRRKLLDVEKRVAREGRGETSLFDGTSTATQELARSATDRNGIQVIPLAMLGNNTDLGLFLYQASKYIQ